jgi:hypothetical protein
MSMSPEMMVMGRASTVTVVSTKSMRFAGPARTFLTSDLCYTIDEHVSHESHTQLALFQTVQLFNLQISVSLQYGHARRLSSAASPTAVWLRRFRRRPNGISFKGG